MKLDEAYINRRLQKHLTYLLTTIARMTHGGMYQSEARRRARAADREWHAIRKLIDKLYTTRGAKKTTPTKIKRITARCERLRNFVRLTPWA